MMLGKRKDIIVYANGRMRTIMKPQAEAETVIRGGLVMTMKRYRKRRIIRYPMGKRG